jgi:transcription elongation GreA/GreB family factor
MDESKERKAFKEAVFKQLKELLSQQIEALEQEVKSIKEARNSDTKSSAGDKFETGRAMMQMEMDKYESGLIKTQRFLLDLEQMETASVQKKIGLGALIITNFETYLLGIPFGKITINQKDVYVLSTLSPLGMALIGKQEGDIIELNGRRIEVMKVC